MIENDGQQSVHNHMEVQKWNKPALSLSLSPSLSVSKIQLRKFGKILLFQNESKKTKIMKLQEYIRQKTNKQKTCHLSYSKWSLQAD